MTTLYSTRDCGLDTDPPAQARVAAATALVEMVRGYQVSQALHVAAVLGLADLVAAGPRSLEELAVETGTHSDALRRLMRVLVSRGVLAEFPDGRYGLTKLGEPMRANIVGSVRGQLLLWGHPMQWYPWADLLHSVRTGEPAFNRFYNVGHWEYLARNPHADEMFRTAMAAHPSHLEVPAAYDFSGLGSIVDIGGGAGRLLAEILRANPSARGILLDRPEVVAAAEPTLQAAGVVGRCEILGGDFFADMPSGADAYILSNVLMDWDDSDAQRLLQRSRQAMCISSRLVVVERVIPADNAPTLSQLGDLMGLVITGGRIRSEHEFDGLFAASGLRRTGTVQTAAGYSILEARPRT